MNTNKQSHDILVLQRSAPYGSSLAREGLDFVLTSAAYDQNISILFLSDGILQLSVNQNSKAIGLKNHKGALDVLPLYDIENLYAIEEDILERGIKPEQLIDGIKIISRSKGKALISKHNKVIGF